ncbi:MAG: hypothetical protein QM784_38650 [Polyangiaceae bacterium]
MKVSIANSVVSGIARVMRSFSAKQTEATSERARCVLHEVGDLFEPESAVDGPAKPSIASGW